MAIAHRFAIAAILLIACTPSNTYSVTGRMLDSEIRFVGTTTIYLNGRHELYLESAGGLSCQGNYVWLHDDDGAGKYGGVLSCNDGSGGEFGIVSDGGIANGTGQIGDDDFIFTYTFGET